MVRNVLSAKHKQRQCKNTISMWILENCVKQIVRLSWAEMIVFYRYRLHLTLYFLENLSSFKLLLFPCTIFLLLTKCCEIITWLGYNTSCVKEAWCKVIEGEMFLLDAVITSDAFNWQIYRLNPLLNASNSDISLENKTRLVFRKFAKKNT